MRKKMLVSGAGGFVGARVARMYSGKYDVTVFPGGMLTGATEQDVLEFARSVRPDVVVHAAAVSDVTYSQQHPEESYRGNVLLSEWMAHAARENGAKLLAFSSDQVYVGNPECGPYSEEQAVCPANTYGQHKLLAEQRVLDILPDAVMLRATWMYDLPGYGLPIKGNSVMNLLTAIAKKQPVRCSVQEVRSVTYVRQVIELLEPAMELPGGAYNFGSENDRNMYDLSVAFLQTLGLGEWAEQFILKEEGRETRWLNMSTQKLQRHGIRFDSAAEGMERLVRDYRLDRL